MPIAVISSAHRGRPSFADPADLDLFVDTLARYERGEIGADEWRAFLWLAPRRLRVFHGEAIDSRSASSL